MHPTNPAAIALIDAAKRRYERCVVMGIPEYICAHAQAQEIIRAESDHPITERREIYRNGLTFCRGCRTVTAPNIIKIPCVTEAFCLARVTLRNPDATAEQITAACDVLAASNDWFDIRMVRNARNVLWSVPGSETGDNFRRLTDEQMAAIGMPPYRVKKRPIDVPDFTEAATQSAYDLRILLFLLPIVTLAGLTIGYAAQWMWRAL